MNTRIAVSINSNLEKQGLKLAKKLTLDFITHPGNDEAKQYDYLLVLTDHYLGLHKTTDKKFAPFYVDFLSERLSHRSKEAGLKKEMLARALGCKPKDNYKIVDATAGWGRDSFILASLGFDITMIERSPIVAALLEDGLNRGATQSAICERMHLVQEDAAHYLNSLDNVNRPDVIYLDPMFPERKKSALVKKEMIILQDILGKSEDNQTLFNTALNCANRRVIVKRPRLAPALSAQEPDFSLAGKSSRFDVYLTRK